MSIYRMYPKGRERERERERCKVGGTLWKLCKNVVFLDFLVIHLDVICQKYVTR